MNTSQSHPLDDELADLRNRLKWIRHEVSAVRYPCTTENCVSRIVSELRAVAYAAESATNTILTIAEAIDSTVELIPKSASEGNMATIVDQFHSLIASLFTECAFQDITGQRISKIVTTLSFIEKRIAFIVQALDESFVQLPFSEQDSGAERKFQNCYICNSNINQADIDDCFEQKNTAPK